MLLDLFGVIFHEAFCLVELTVDVATPVTVYCIPLADEGIGEAEVHYQIARPFLRDREAVYHIAPSIPGIFIDTAFSAYPLAKQEAFTPHTCQSFENTEDVFSAFLCPVLCTGIEVARIVLVVGAESRCDAFIHALVEPVVRRIGVDIHNELPIWQVWPVGARSGSDTHELYIIYLALYPL